ncbi:MAG: hypothetical protein JW697_02970, partial [Kosmotogaceae bacterium]|nr:hypothetical protein [Kosmotogaceae bacterium]
GILGGGGDRLPTTVFSSAYSVFSQACSGSSPAKLNWPRQTNPDWLSTLDWHHEVVLAKAKLSLAAIFFTF